MKGPNLVHWCDIAKQSQNVLQCVQSTVRKTMATGTFAYNALHMKTLKKRIKHKEKL